MEIEWNRVTWFSKILAAILFVDVFFFGFWLGTMNTEIQYIEIERVVRAGDTTVVPAVPAAQEDVWNEYRNEKYGYRFEYPTTMSLAGSESSKGRYYKPRTPAGTSDSIVFIRGDEKNFFRVESTNDTGRFNDWKQGGYQPPLYREETNGERSETFVRTTIFNGYPAIETLYCDLGGCENNFIIERNATIYTVGVRDNTTEDFARIVNSFTLFE